MRCRGASPSPCPGPTYRQPTKGASGSVRGVRDRTLQGSCPDGWRVTAVTTSLGLWHSQSIRQNPNSAMGNCSKRRFADPEWQGIALSGRVDPRRDCPPHSSIKGAEATRLQGGLDLGPERDQLPQVVFLQQRPWLPAPAMPAKQNHKVVGGTIETSLKVGDVSRAPAQGRFDARYGLHGFRKWDYVNYRDGVPTRAFGVENAHAQF
jgi:hypothetical protein